ncbi:MULTISPECIES: hypothetical protein [unclassified Nostoc]|nr:hypothetical protein [Nostoc sp. S13]MDF5736856.1 hypothetical protein [Nostoc sp. S13]
MALPNAQFAFEFIRELAISVEDLFKPFNLQSGLPVEIFIG